MKKLKIRFKNIFNNMKLKYRLLFLLIFAFILIFGTTTYFLTYSDLILEFQDDPDFVDSKISGNKVLVNDLENDYNYYQGLNYTSNDGTLPTTDNKNIYNENNLVQVKITYLSDDDNNHKGYVSLNERQDTYVYFKTYDVNDNETTDTSDDYILIELIDNPFTDKPTDKAFNGWFTDYNGAVISFDSVYYERFAKVPITYTDSKPDKVDIVFRASWTNADKTLVNSINAFNNAINALDSSIMKELTLVRLDMTGYYYQVSVGLFESCSGYYNNEGQLQKNCTCYRPSCTYYDRIEGENFNKNNTYYELRDNNMQLVDNDSLDREAIVDDSFINGNMSSFYRKVNISSGSIVGYYDSNGNLMTSGTCNTNGGCEYYELIQYYKEDGTEELFDENETYYYLVTRDTNIVVVTGNISGSWSNTSDKPFTVTALDNGTLYNSTWNVNSAVNCYGDTRIENITIYYETNINDIYNPPTRTNTAGVLFGRYNNVKIGRGIKRNGTYPNFGAVVAGNGGNSGSNNNPTKYKMVIESGIYNSISLSTGASKYINSTLYLKNKSVYGNDYDRVNKNNSNLDVYYCASGSWSGNVYGTTNNRNSTDIVFDLTVKSGTFGSSKYDLTTGIYVGGRFGGNHYAARRVKVEGGYIYNLIGGPLTGNTRSGVNDIYINMTGGEVDLIIGGAGESATYGNRIIMVTGGVVNYSVFGGSNGVKGADGEGTLIGTPYVYIGGNAIIGKDSYVTGNSKLFGAEAGSVFGIGNGSEGSSTIGSADNSIIVIDGDASIKRNVYGGGNFGAVGVSSNLSSTYSKIVINDGFIDGDVYGGGNNNGSGSARTTSSIDITMNGGNVVGSIYGGANELGTIYGSTSVKVLGGEVTNNVYGGGKGGYESSSVIGTFVRDQVEVVIGDSASGYTPIIDGSVYGGSALGTVNGSENSSTVSTNETLVTVNKGIITNVFGGGQGDSSKKAYVLGNITVTINDGTITNVFGGNDKNGTPNGDIYVYINNGNITSTYGGGNETSAKETNVYLNGGSSNKIFGGSNISGVVNTSNVEINAGISDSVYGGNNQGGTTGVTNVYVNGGDINFVYGGGEKTSVTENTNVTLNGEVNNVFGGSNLEGSVPNSYINVINGGAINIYGGNNQGGNTENSHIDIYGGYIENVYGGGLKAETGTTNVNLYYGRVDNLFGGGSEAGATTTNVGLGNGTVNKVFGGSNISGDVNDSYVRNITSPSKDNIVVDTSFTESTINNSSATNISSSETINVKITNNTSANISKWKLYIFTSKGILDSNWSSAMVYASNGSFYANHVNQWYGTNTLSSGSSYEFSFNIHSYVNFEDFKIYGYSFVGYDDASNKYIGYKQDKIEADSIYGGNNQGGITTTSHIDMTSGNVNLIYGGGEKATTGNSNLDINGVNVNTAIYGGGNEASTESVVLGVTSSTVGTSSNNGNIFGGGNAATVNNDVRVIIDDTTVYGNVYGGGNLGNVLGSVVMDVTSSDISSDIYGAGNAATVGSSENDTVVNLNVTNTSANNIFGGGNAASVNGSTNVIVTSSNVTNAIYGGGNGINSIVSGDETGESNPAKVIGNTNVRITGGTTALDIYGGGNLGMVNKNTNVTLETSNINNSIYGGGNASVVGGSTYLLVTGANVTNSVYAGGNGTNATVYGNTSLDIDNGSVIDGHVFGGGNAAKTGSIDTNNSKGNVNIAGATIGKNVYGGANTSVLYGDTTINIGKEVVTNDSLISSDINIGGTVFGGGEANASGSEDYDFTFISVTVGINININGLGHDNFNIGGSIFGSGNASSTEGYSYIDIANYGSNNDIKKNISIQRADVVTLDNSYIELSGAMDRTNEYSTVLFTLSRIDELKLKNNSEIYLQKGANLLKKFTSLVDNNGTEEIASVIIDNETGTLTRNVNNRLYMLEGENLNIALDQNIRSYGDVSGMTFFGMYLHDRNGNVITALYDDYNYGDNVSSGDIYYFTSGSYVLGKHYANHDITKDGFYSNYGSEDGTSVIMKYIEPTPEDADYYMWVIGETVVSYDISLTASKYSTLGTVELSLLNHATANTTFSILGVNYNDLDPNIELVPYTDIPRIASTSEEANTVFGLNMKSGQAGFITKGSTNFVTEGDNNILGTISYERENSNVVPSFVFYFYHSKNITDAGSLGTVTISLVAITPIDDLNNDVQRININVDLSKALYNTNDYEGTIAPGKKYEMFATSNTDITTKSSFSTYYSLFMESNESPYKEGYHRSLVSTYAFPVNTKITMIDFHEDNKPVYYYYVIDENDYNSSVSEYNTYGEVSYNLSKFVKMGSTSVDNNYNDSLANSKYYSNGTALEEFIFIVDFKEANIDTDVLSKKLLIELRNNDDQTLISVLGIEQATMNYNLYSNSDATVEVDASLSDSTVYLGNSTNLTVDTNFVQNKINTNTIYDTNFGDEKLGIKLSILDSYGNLLSSSSLMGVNFEFNGNTYYPRYDGTVRINIAERVANARTKIKINTENSNLATGEYTLLIESFGSSDGIYYSSGSNTSSTSIRFNIIDTLYGLSIDIADSMVFIDKTSGFTLNDNNNYVFNLNYASILDNPNTRIKLLRRDYSSIYNNIYNEVNLSDYVTNTLTASGKSNEYYLSTSPTATATYFLYFKENLVSGTYKLVISLYDGDNYIGEIYQYIIIK